MINVNHDADADDIYATNLSVVCILFESRSKFAVVVFGCRANMLIIHSNSTNSNQIPPKPKPIRTVSKRRIVFMGGKNPQ